MALRKSTILVVDDNQDIRDLVTLILADEGFTTLDAKDALEAMAVLEKSQPALVLLDVMMPGKSGIELLREIRAHRDSRIN
ncbi:MAG: response regulator, partial [Actinobacteria bacterium]|nr:response regulator [Actinomycetota bacterium]